MHFWYTKVLGGFRDKGLPRLRGGDYVEFELFTVSTVSRIGHFAIRSGYSIVELDTPGSFDVDMVANWLPEEATNSPFIHIHQLPKEHLAVFQHWLKALCAGSHMRCTLKN